jgi:hypothetical protein
MAKFNIALKSEIRQNEDILKSDLQKASLLEGMERIQQDQNIFHEPSDSNKTGRLKTLEFCKEVIQTVPLNQKDKAHLTRTISSMIDGLYKGPEI